MTWSLGSAAKPDTVGQSTTITAMIRKICNSLFLGSAYSIRKRAVKESQPYGRSCR